jgi:hypothetical protein
VHVNEGRHADPVLEPRDARLLALKVRQTW